MFLNIYQDIIAIAVASPIFLSLLEAKPHFNMYTWVITLLSIIFANM